MTRKKKFFISGSILLFFAFCLYQPLGIEREDWPFSFFGMYRGALYPQHVTRVDVDIVMPDGKLVSIFALGMNFYFLQDVLDFYVDSPASARDPEVHKKLQDFLKSDILPVMKKKKFLQQAGEIRMRYRHWENFTLDTKDKPVEDFIFLHYPLSESTDGAL
jgi:hypothetical protein